MKQKNTVRVLSVVGVAVVAMATVIRAEDNVSAESVAAPMPVAPAASTVSSDAPEAWEEQGGQEFVAQRVDSGNWLIKAKILNQTNKLMTHINAAEKQLEPYDKDFMQQRAAIDKKHREFYQEYGFRVADVDAMLVALETESKQLGQKGAELSADDKKLIDDVKAKQEELKKLKEDLALVNELDAALDTAIAELLRYIGEARGLASVAWDDRESIAKTLSDEVAEDLYRKMETHLANMQQANHYLSTTFKDYFTTQVTALDSAIDTLRRDMDAIKERGLALGKKLTEQLAQEAKAKKAQEDKARGEKERAAAQTNAHWYTAIIGWFLKMISAIGAFFARMYAWVRSMIGL